MSRASLPRVSLPLLLAALLAPSAALADSAFILPSNTSLSGEGSVVTFDAAGSDHLFFFDHRPLQLNSIRVVKPDGAAGAPSNGQQGRFRSVFDLTLDQAGTWKVVSEQTMVSGVFKLNGEERRVGGRGGPPPQAARVGAAGGEARAPGAAPSGPNERGPRGPEGGSGGGGPPRQPPVALEDIPAEATDVHLIENVRTTQTFVSLGAPTSAVLKPTGKALELEPITHPNALVAGETARFRFLVDGKPAAGVKVTVVPGGDRYREDLGAMALTTGADGVVSIRWPTAGMYWVSADAEDRSPAEKRAEFRRMSCAVTVEVMTP